MTSVNEVEKAVGEFLDSPACQDYFANRTRHPVP